MFARLSILAVVFLCSFVVPSTARSQVQSYRRGEAGYFAHPTLFSLELDKKDRQVVTGSLVMWPFWLHNTETERMKLDGTKVVEKKRIAKQKFQEYDFGTHLEYYTGYDLQGKELSLEQLQKRITDGAIGIRSGHDPQKIAEIYRSVFEENTFIWMPKPWDQHELFDKEARDLRRKRTFQPNNNHTGLKSVGDEGYFHCPNFIEEISVDKGRLKGTTVLWKAVVDEPEMVQTVVGPMLDFPFASIDPSAYKLKREFRFDRLECRTPSGELIEPKEAIKILNSVGAVAIYLGKGQKLHPTWAKAVKKTVVVVSKATKKNDPVGASSVRPNETATRTRKGTEDPGREK